MNAEKISDSLNVTNVFQIKVGNYKPYFDVVICATKKDLLKYRELYQLEHKIKFKKDKKGFEPEGYVTYWELTKPPKNLKRKEFKLGEIVLYKKKLGAGVVAHEVLHACIWYDRVVNKNTNATYGMVVNPKEERLCYIMTALIRDIYKNLYKLNIIQ